MSVQDLRNRILGYKAAIPTMDVDGIGTVGCRVLSAGEFMSLREYVKRDETTDLDAMARTFVLCACEPETGAALFAESDASDVAAHVPFAILQSVTAWMGSVQFPDKDEAAGN